MVGQRLGAYRRRLREGLRAAFSEERSPRAIASSFSFGVFVSALPNLGVALVLFAVLARFVDSVSKLALVAAVLVMNPPAKWAVYAASYWLGARILGPLPDASVSELSVDVGPQVLVRLLLGNLLIAAIVAAVGYVLALRVVRRLQRERVDLGEAVPAALVGEGE